MHNTPSRRLVMFHAFVLVTLVASSMAFAQTPSAASDVLTGKQLTTDNVLDALDPQAVRTRSFTLSGRRPSSQPVRASASLLVTFETNSADLTQAARRQLDVVAAALRNDRIANYGFTVEGHADPRGEPDANLALSKERADSVKAYLVARHGIEATRLNVEARGDREPVNRNMPAAPENRRVTFVTRQN